MSSVNHQSLQNRSISKNSYSLKAKTVSATSQVKSGTMGAISLASFTNSIGEVFELSLQVISRMIGKIDKIGSIITKKKVSVRQLQRELENVKPMLRYLKLSGVKNLPQIGKKLNKRNIINFMKALGEVVKDMKFTVVASKIVKCLKPVMNFFNKIPGLKYSSVIDKLAAATIALFKMEFEKAFGLYCDALRILLEQILIDAAVAALVASGLVVVALVLVLLLFIIDYFLFSDNPGESLVDKFTPLHTTNLVTQHAAPFTYNLVNRE